MIKKNIFSFKAAILTAVISMIFGTVGSLINYSLINRAPALEYELFPISYFKKDSFKLSIVNIKIVNDGSKECEDVSFDIDLNSEIKPIDCTWEKSSESIMFTQKLDSISGKIHYSIPYLNPKEQIVYSFLLNKTISESNIKIDLRSKGINGKKLNSDENVKPISIILIFGTLGMFFMAITLTSVVIFHQRRVINFNKQLQRQLEEQIKELKNQI